MNVRRVPPEQIVVFAQQDAFGDAGFAGVAKAIRTMRLDAAAVLRLNYRRNTVDVDEAVAQLRVQATVMVATYRAAAKFIEKTRDLYPAAESRPHWKTARTGAREASCADFGIGVGALTQNRSSLEPSLGFSGICHRAAAPRF
jgi:hypothetical protein